MTAKHTYKIGEVARLVGRSENTLRNWDRDGKLVPDRTEFGQRVYRKQHIEIAVSLVRNRKG